MRNALAAALVAAALTAGAAGSATAPLPGARVAAACRTAAIPYPQGALAAAAGSLWVACRDAGKVERRSPSGKLIATIGTGSVRPWAVAAAAGFVWVVDRDAPTLLRVAPGRNRVTARIALPEPAIAVWGVASEVWLAFDGSGSIARVDTRTNHVGRAVSVGDGPSGLAAAGPSTFVLSHRDGSLVRFDGATARRLTAQPADERRTPERIAAAGGSLWVTGRGLDLERVAPETGSHRSTTEIGAAGIDVLRVGGRVAAIVATPAGARRGDPTVGSVAFVDPATGAVVRRMTASGPVSSNGSAVVGGRLVVLDGLHGRLLTLPR